jgi:hypothetical protein
MDEVIRIVPDANPGGRDNGIYNIAGYGQEVRELLNDRCPGSVGKTSDIA